MNRTCHRLLVAACLLLLAAVPAWTGSAPPANRYSRAWTSKDGLKGSQVWTLLQDRAGYLWLGTNEGLVRFDGVGFHVWPAFGAVSLPNGSVRALSLARDGTMWIGFGGTGGVSRVRDGRLRNYSSNDGLPTAIVLGVLEDQAGVAWALTAVGLFRLSAEHWEPITEQQGLPSGTISALFEDRRGDLWAGTTGGIYRRTAGAESFLPVADIAVAEGFSEDRSGTVWAVGSAGLFAFAEGGRVRAWQALAGTRIEHDGDGHLWLATLGGGLLHVDPDRAEPVLHRYHGEAVLTSDLVRAVLQDREGNIWVGTQSGLNRLSEAVVTMLADDDMGPLARAMTATGDDAVWIGTNMGLHRVQGGAVQRFTEADGLPSASIRALHATPDGLWVATAGGIARRTPRGFEVVPGSGEPRPTQVMAIAQDRLGDLWVGDMARGLIRYHDGRPSVIVGAKTGRPFSVAADSKGRIWTGFTDGVLTIHDGDQSRSFSDKEGFVGGMVTSLREEPEGTMWIGSSKGLSRSRDGHFDRVTWANGLPGNLIGAIVPDGLGHLWLGSSSGIIRIALTEIEKAFADSSYQVQYVLYDASDGLRGDPIGFGAPTSAQTHDGMLWFITSDGVARLNVHQAVKNRLPPPVVIESIVADAHDISQASGEPLPARTGNLQINYAGLGLRAPEKVTFKYLMEGFDTQWVDAGTRRQAFYTNLPPGGYRFRVKADNDGAASETEAIWSFSIAPAFNQTGWFRLLLVVAGAAIATGAWRLRVRGVRSQFALILVERSRLAREIHDTLLQSLLGVMLRLDEVERTVDVSADSAKQQLGRLRQQVEFYIREARQSIRDLRSPVLQTRDLVTALQETGARLTAGHAAFEYSATGRARRVPVKVEEHLLRIAQEAISNAIRHAAPRVVTVTLAYADDSLALRVADDGTGFDVERREQPDDHWGITSMQERANQIEARFLLTSEPGRGTVLEVQAPLG